jgi:hypothetical protein
VLKSLASSCSAMSMHVKSSASSLANVWPWAWWERRPKVHPLACPCHGCWFSSPIECSWIDKLPNNNSLAITFDHPWFILHGFKMAGIESLALLQPFLFTFNLMAPRLF